MKIDFYKSKIFFLSCSLFFIVFGVNFFSKMNRYSAIENIKTMIFIAIISILFGLVLWFLYTLKIKVLAISIMLTTMISLIKTTILVWPQTISGHYTDLGSHALAYYSFLGIVISGICECIYRLLISKEHAAKKIIISIVLVIVIIFLIYIFFRTY